MNMPIRTLIAALVICLCEITGAWAQSNPLYIVLPFPAATPSAELARQMSVRLAAKLERPVVVEYKPGGNSRVAQDHVRAAKPDGNTLLWAVSSIVVEPVLAGKPQDLARDLQPLALGLRASLVMVSRPGLAHRDFSEILASLRSGGTLSCGYGSGAMLLACTALKQLNPQGVVLVGYASSGLALPDVAGERLDVAFTLLEPVVKALVAAGKVQMLGRTSTGGNDPSMATVPRIDRILPALAISPWQGWFAPAGTPPESTQLFLRVLQEVMQDSEMRKQFSQFDFRPDYVPEPEFSKMLHSEYLRFTQLLQTVR